MNTENQENDKVEAPHSLFLRRILSFTLVLIVLGGAGYMAFKNPQGATTPSLRDFSPTVETPTDPEKLRILESLSKQVSTSTVTEKEKLRILKNLQSNASKTSLSDEEKLRILGNLALRAN
ncbi:MAG: hypothetical protein Q7K40_01090 [bacterium]|nr:hypothetical protein [bacterium]